MNRFRVVELVYRGLPARNRWCASISYYSFSMTAIPNSHAPVRGDAAVETLSNRCVLLIFSEKRCTPQNSEERQDSVLFSAFSQSFEAEKLRSLPKLWSSSIGPETLRGALRVFALL
eukprot:6861677-Prymnesium_polylepis.1